MRSAQFLSKSVPMPLTLPSSGTGGAALGGGGGACLGLPGGGGGGARAGFLVFGGGAGGCGGALRGGLPAAAGLASSEGATLRQLDSSWRHKPCTKTPLHEIRLISHPHYLTTLPSRASPQCATLHGAMQKVRGCDQVPIWQVALNMQTSSRGPW